MSVGPGRTGPSIVLVSSVKTVTSCAIELSFSSGDWSRRQMRPAPGGCGSMSVISSGGANSSSAGEQALEQHDRARARSDEDDSPSTGIRHGHPPTATGASVRTGGRPSRSRSVAPSS